MKLDHHLTPEERLTKPVLTGKTSGDLNALVLFDEITDYLYARRIELRIGLSNSKKERSIYVAPSQLVEAVECIARISEVIRQRLEAELQEN